MASLDIGIDLGTNNMAAGNRQEGLLVEEPSVIAADTRSKKILGIGQKIYGMIGRENQTIKIVYPIEDGVISDYGLALELTKFLFAEVGKSVFFKPRVISCIPSDVTGLEAQSMLDLMYEAGARSVMLMQQPVAAALGAGIAIEDHYGNLVVDIGAGTTDVTVLSMGGVVSSSSTLYAGNSMDVAIQKHLHDEHNIIVGSQMAEYIKNELASVWQGSPNTSMVVKGRGIVTGLPTKLLLHRSDLFPIFEDVIEGIIRCIQQTMERTPPELAGDISTNGLHLTGGGAYITGMKEMLEKAIRVPVIIPEDPKTCALRGTLKAFDYWSESFEGFYFPKTLNY